MKTVEFTLRMKEPLRAAIQRSAKVRGTSMNAEIVRRLEKSDPADVLDKMSEQLDCIEAYAEVLYRRRPS